MAKRLAMVLYCMEADQSTAAWYDDLMKELGNLAKALYALEFGNAALPGLPGADLVTLATELAKLGVILMESLRNYDDLSATRGIAFTAFDMALLYHRDGGNVAYHFNGDGHHELRMKYTGEPVPFPTGTLEYLIQDEHRAWGAPITLGWESMSAPTLAAYKGKLYAAFIRPSDQAVMWSVQEAGIWSEPQQLGRWRSYFPPGLGAAHGKHQRHRIRPQRRVLAPRDRPLAQQSRAQLAQRARPGPRHSQRGDAPALPRHGRRPVHLRRRHTATHPPGEGCPDGRAGRGVPQPQALRDVPTLPTWQHTHGGDPVA
ncbi:hypothetical protein ACWGJW_23335 [Streptomyces nigrescens]